jgi:DNA-binding response OmpR family regulator
VATILVAEDDAGVREFLLAALRRAGHTAMPAHNGRDALDVLEAFDEPIDLLVSDINMPGIGGVELVSLARQRGDHLPILMMSGTNRFEFRRATLPEDVTILEKPFGTEALLAAIDMALRPQGT